MLSAANVIQMALAASCYAESKHKGILEANFEKSYWILDNNDSELMCTQCCSATEAKLVIISTIRKISIPFLSLEKGEPREVYTFRARATCSSSL